MKNRKLQNESLGKGTQSDTGKPESVWTSADKGRASEQSSAQGPITILHPYKYSVK